MAGKNGEAEGAEGLTFESEDQDDTPKPVAIDLSDEAAAPIAVEGEETPAAEEVKAEPEKKTEPRDHPRKASQRIKELWNKERQTQAENADLRRQIEAVNAEKAALAARATVVDQAAMDTHEQRWKTEEEAAKRELAAAHEKQDYAAVAEATSKLSSAASELQAIRAYKANLPAPRDAAKAVVPERGGNGQEQPQAQELPPEMQAWVDENPYLVAGTADFDQEMAGFAVTAAATLDGRYRRAGRSAEIGTEGYLGDLTNLIKEEFPEYWEDQPAPVPQARQQQMRRVPMTRPNGAQVAPVSRQTIAQPGAAANTVVLSPREQAMAQKMAANGAYKYPAGHANAGKNMNEQDALRYHARFVKADRTEQAAKKEQM